jgi:hypothetical protein
MCGAFRAVLPTSVGRPSFPRYVVDEAAVKDMGAHKPGAAENAY